MAQLTGLFERGGAYYLRVVLPLHHPLLDRYKSGKVVSSLGRCSHREALRLGTIKRAEILWGESFHPGRFILSFLTASLATIQPFLNYTRDTHKMHDIGSQWHQLEIEFEAIWRTLESNGFSEKKFKELKNQTVEISKKATELPWDDQTLQSECQKALLKFRGLKND